MSGCSLPCKKVIPRLKALEQLHRNPPNRERWTFESPSLHGNLGTLEQRVPTIPRGESRPPESGGLKPPDMEHDSRHFFDLEFGVLTVKMNPFE